MSTTQTNPVEQFHYPIFHFDLVDGAFTGFTRLSGKSYPCIVSPPDFRYVELFARADGGEIKRIAYWCSPFQPWAYVVYQDWLFKANVVELIATFTDLGTYPKPNA